MNEGLLIKHAAKIMNINYNTAKTIIRKLKIDNRIFKKKKMSKNSGYSKTIEQKGEVDICLVKDYVITTYNFIYKQKPTEAPVTYELNKIDLNNLPKQIDEKGTIVEQTYNVQIFQNNNYQNIFQQIHELQQKLNGIIKEVSRQDQILNFLLTHYFLCNSIKNTTFS